MNIALSFTPFLIFFAQGLSLKMFGKKCVSVGGKDSLFASYYFFIGLLLVIPFALTQPLNSLSLLVGLPFGVVLVSLVVIYNKALATAPFAYVNFIMSLSMLIPTFGGVIFLNNTMKVTQYIGLGIFFIAFYLICFSSKTVGVDKSLKASLTRVIACICSGSVGLFINIASNKIEGFNNSQFFLSGCAIAVVITLAVCLFKKDFVHIKQNMGNTKWFLLLGIVVGVGTLGGNMMLAYLSPIVNSAILYPITNGMPIITATAISPLFKEKINLKGYIGMAVGVVAIILLNI